MESDETKEGQGQIHIPAANLQGILELARQFQADLEAESQEVRARADSVSAQNQQEIAVFEKLILLDGGTFVLTLTFLSALGSHIHKSTPFGLHLGWMYTGWILLLISMMLGWAHNYLLHVQSVRMHNASTVRTSSTRNWSTGVWVRKFASLITGSISVDGTEIDISKLMAGLGKAITDESSKSMYQVPETHLARASILGTQAFRFGALAVLCTVLAVTCVLIFAMLTAYIFVLPS